LFELADRSPTGDSESDPAALAGVSAGWRVLVGRDRRPIGVRLTMSRADADAPAPCLREVLDGVLAGLTFETDGEPVFPHGLIVLSPQNLDADQAMSDWRAPRNVLLEFGQGELDDESRLRRTFEIQKQGVRLALRLDQPAAAAPERLSYFQYLVASSRRELPRTVDPGSFSILTLNDSTHADLDADFAAGVHATAGWPLVAVRRAEPGGLTPAQAAVFELIRLVQADADVGALERVFRGEPLLAYLLLTLANSSAFRRPTPVSSLGHAISLLGYQRLIKWLVLLLAIAGKEQGTAPLVYVAVVRGHLLENLLAAAGCSRSERDDGFVVGTFSLLDAITGQSMSDLLQDIRLPATITDALLGCSGRYAALLGIARDLEAADPLTLVRTRAELGVGPAQVNRALLAALAAADSLQSLI
jgi:EAL and modified HD-GYP domain-containing signal transduction protein